jgi:putative copper export protein
VDRIGYYIMIALLGAGAAYGLMQKGKPRPALSTKKRNVAIVLFGIALGCILLALVVGLASQHPPSH